MLDARALCARLETPRLNVLQIQLVKNFTLYHLPELQGRQGRHFSLATRRRLSHA
jgi:hypothetical protein